MKNRIAETVPMANKRKGGNLMKNGIAKTIPMALALILMLTMVAGCPPYIAPEEPPAVADKVLIVGGPAIAASLDTAEPLTYLVRVGAAETLFKVNSQAEVEPFLAESATEIDATTWEIKLRPNVYFWSGKAVDASAVIASLERSRELNLSARPFLDGLTFTRVDEYTIQVKTIRQHMEVPLNLSHFHTVIHNAEAKHDCVDTMDLTGMYKVVEFIPNERMVLERNENYWGQKPVIRRVVHEEIPDPETRVLAALSGDYHIVTHIPAESVPRFRDRKEVRLVAAPPANTNTIYLNLRRPQLQDVRVRQALSWALDRDELVMLAAEGQSFPVTTWLSSNPAFAEARNAVFPMVDREKASQLLDEAGWIKGPDGVRYKDGNPLTIRLMTWGVDKALGEVIQHQWTRIGVKAEVQHGDYSLIIDARKAGDWEALIEGWSTFGGDIYSLLKGQFSPEGGANYGGFNDEETNALFAQLAKATTDAERHELALKINERVAYQAPVIALFPRPLITAVSTSLEGFEEHFRQFENTVNANLSFVDHSN